MVGVWDCVLGNEINFRTRPNPKRVATAYNVTVSKNVYLWLNNNGRIILRCSI